MSPPSLRINTFVQPTVKPFVDSVTKAYIIGELFLGVNRLSILTCKSAYIIPSLVYSVVTLCGILHVLISYKDIYILHACLAVKILLYVTCIILSIVFSKRMHYFYDQLYNFDTEVGCRPKFVRASMRNLIQAYAVIVYILTLLFYSYQKDNLANLIVYVLPAHITQTLEVHYYGHLLNLLTPRLRLINHYMDISLTSKITAKESIFNEHKFFKNEDKRKDCEMKKIMDLYYIIVQSYNYLNEAIKWQLLLIIISSFISVLGFCYHFSEKVIRSSDVNVVDHLISDLSLTLIVIIPLFEPCIFGDRVHDEVRRLRQLLACRLYVNKQDKSSRSIARTLLDYTDTRNLSFTLLRILNIDISLPFKFVGLLATYLIILLQFEKVLNP